jgi:hypothetical protein
MKRYALYRCDDHCSAAGSAGTSATSNTPARQPLSSVSSRRSVWGACEGSTRTRGDEGGVNLELNEM